MTVNEYLSIAVINQLQGGFPVIEEPYAEVASRLNTDESTLISTISQLLDDGWLSRFGPLYNAKQMGGGLTLAAIEVPEPRFEEITELVNGYAQVAHNYRRDHALNMWFVVAAETESGMLEVIEDIEQRSGLRVYNCPKIQEFYVGLQLCLSLDGRVDTVPLETDWKSAKPGSDKTLSPDEFDRRLIAATQSGLALVSRPFEQIAEKLGSDSTHVMRRMQALLENGSMRRLGAVPNHYKLGLRGNGMTVWDVPDEMTRQIGEAMGAMDFVSHCYLRPRHRPNWPYNIFAMIHGADRAQVMHKLSKMEAELLPYAFPHKVLFSSAVLKKTGLRLLQ